MPVSLLKKSPGKSVYSGCFLHYPEPWLRGGQAAVVAYPPAGAWGCIADKIGSQGPGPSGAQTWTLGATERNWVPRRRVCTGTAQQTGKEELTLSCTEHLFWSCT